MKTYITVFISALVGLFSIFGFFSNKLEKKAEKEDVKELEEEVIEQKLIDKEQSIYLEQIQQNQLKFIEEFKELQRAK